MVREMGHEGPPHGNIYLWKLIINLCPMKSIIIFSGVKVAQTLSVTYNCRKSKPFVISLFLFTLNDAKHSFTKIGKVFPFYFHLFPK